MICRGPHETANSVRAESVTAKLVHWGTSSTPKHPHVRNPKVNRTTETARKMRNRVELNVHFAATETRREIRQYVTMNSITIATPKMPIGKPVRRSENGSEVNIHDFSNADASKRAAISAKQ